MARSRTLKPGFFTNEDLAECSMAARIVYAGLWCIADREGRLEDRPKRIKALVLPHDCLDMNDLLVELESHKFITRYESDGVKCISINKFRAHQTPHPKEAKSELPPPSNVKVVASNGNYTASNVTPPIFIPTVGRGLKEDPEGPEDPVQGIQKQEAIVDRGQKFFRPPDVDGTTADVLRKLGEINAEAKRSPTVSPSANDRDRLSEAICTFGRDRVENLWRWAINSPHPRSKFFQQKKLLTVRQIYDPDKVGELMELSEQLDAWTAEIREGPKSESEAGEDIIEQFKRQQLADEAKGKR